MSFLYSVSLPNYSGEVSVRANSLEAADEQIRKVFPNAVFMGVQVHP